MALSPDGKTVAVGGWVATGRQTEGPIYLVDLATGRLVRTLSDHVRPVTSLSFGPGGKRLASGSQDGTVRVWDPTAGKAEAVLRGHTGSLFQVAFAPDGKRVASTAIDMTVRVWPATGGDTDLVLRDQPVIATRSVPPTGGRNAAWRRPRRSSLARHRRPAQLR
jgi:WD40 repeat protein